MSHPAPIRPEDIARFEAVIDVRSPAEFAEDHVPGAINCPVLDDAERAIVGTLYVQQGAFEARRVGGAMVAAHLAEHLRGAFAEQPASWRPLVYCWRGGMRSGSMVQWMRLVGWKAEQLAGGYKSFRKHVINGIQTQVPRMRIRAVVGATGSAKTRVLHALATRGAQVLDLEGMARHKGSLLGNLPGVPQPSQKHFETQIWAALQAMDLTRPIYVEGESSRIGRLSVPPVLVQQLRAAPCVEIDATPEARLGYLLRDYAYLGDEPEELAERLSVLIEMHGRETVRRWQAWARKAMGAPPLALSFSASALNTSTNKRPMVLRLRSGSWMPASSRMNSGPASTRTTFACSLPANIAMTMSPSLRRSRPWSTNTQVSCSPMARWISAAATLESTPPERPSSTCRSPTCVRMRATASATWSCITQSGRAAQMPSTKRSSIALPCAVCVTSGWNCTP